MGPERTRPGSSLSLAAGEETGSIGFELTGSVRSVSPASCNQASMPLSAADRLRPRSSAPDGCASPVASVESSGFRATALVEGAISSPSPSAGRFKEPPGACQDVNHTVRPSAPCKWAHHADYPAAVRRYVAQLDAIDAPAEARNRARFAGAFLPCLSSNNSIERSPNGLSKRTGFHGLMASLRPQNGDSQEPKSYGQPRPSLTPRPDVSFQAPSAVSDNSTGDAALSQDGQASGSKSDPFGLTNQQKKSACCLAWNVQQMAEKYGLERLGFFTLTFVENLTDRSEAQRRWNSLATNVLRKRYEAGIRVVERQKRGAVHYHCIVVLDADIRTGYSFERDKENGKGYDPHAPQSLKNEWAFWGNPKRPGAAARYGFGRVEMKPIESTSEGIARYIGKYLSKHYQVRKLEDRGWRLAEYWGDSRMARTRFAWSTDNAASWRAKCRTFAQIVNEWIKDEAKIRGLPLIGDDDMEGLGRWLGPHWAYDFREFIFSLPGHDAGSNHRTRTDGSILDTRSGEIINYTSSDPTEIEEPGPLASGYRSASAPVTKTAGTDTGKLLVSHHDDCTGQADSGDSGPGSRHRGAEDRCAHRAGDGDIRPANAARGSARTGSHGGRSGQGEGITSESYRDDGAPGRSTDMGPATAGVAATS